MSDIFSVGGLMRLMIAITLDVATLFCLALYTLGPVGMFIGETLSYLPKILSVVFLGNWDLRGKKKKLKNKKILLKLIPTLGDLPLNTFYVLSNT